MIGQQAFDIYVVFKKGGKKRTNVSCDSLFLDELEMPQRREKSRSSSNQAQLLAFRAGFHISNEQL